MEIDNKLYELVEVFLKEYWNKNKATEVTVQQFIEACTLKVIVETNTTNDLPKTTEALDKFLGIEEDGVLPLEDSSEEK